MLIERLKERFNSNEPIFTSEILEIFKEYSRAYVFRLIDKAEKNNEIINFDTGVYFIPTNTLIGFSTITTEDVVDKKYVRYKDEVYGVYSGLHLKNMFSITTQMPNTIEIISNKESMRCRKINISGMDVILRSSRCKINKSNFAAYTVLQLLSEIKQYNEINKTVKDSITKYMRNNKVKNSDLLELANFFPAQTLKNLIYSGVLNDFTQGQIKL